MDDDFEAFLNDADAQADRDMAKAQPSKTQQKFPCGQCNGTGRYQGPRVHQHKTECFACQGNGYFLTDPRKLQEKRQAKQIKEAARVSAFILAHEALLEGLAGTAGWNTFAREMLGQLGLAPEDVSRRIQGIKAGFTFKGGRVLSDNQVAACERMLAKVAQREEERAAAWAAEEAEQKKRAVEVDLAPIREMFETAVGNGYKKPTYRAEGLVISRAPDSGSNPGALYIKDEAGEYMGKIIGTEFRPVRGAGEVKGALLTIAGDPLAAALRYGQRTGRCACCGRELTNHASIDAGIGPICRDKWGL